MGGGGPAKAAQPTVTPFVDPAAPKNPVQNWFAGSTQAPGSGANTFTPNFNQSASAFGNVNQMSAQSTPTQAVTQQQVNPTPVVTESAMTYNPAWQNQVADMGNYTQPVTPFSIPSRPQWQGRQGHQFDFSQLQNMLPPGLLQMLQRFNGMNGAPRFGFGSQNMPLAKYHNYTDTNPDLSTDFMGRPINRNSGG